ncbi:hypothetical protein NW762_008054 [Fusarium torreyae]|uniref:F-box domain-containing protein n=1 Tax=Fusarium torreyae TaxID=1237075 RepID=A0A9W8RWX1_9HYPO|nr:hypothetical protein NW762_008054 [Fusarium torreyae]
MVSDRTSANDPPRITEFASERYFEKLNQINTHHQQEQRTQDSAGSLTSGTTKPRLISPLRASNAAANKSPQPLSQKCPGHRHSNLKPTRQSKLSLFESSTVGLPAKQSSVPLDRFFLILPSELQIQIISSLPLSDLLNLRISSRQWHSLITLNEVPIAHYHLENYIPTYAQRLYPIIDQSSLSLHHICGLWHRHHVAAKLSNLMCEWITHDIFLRETNAQQTAFAPKKQRMRRRLTWLLFHIFHFFETYRIAHLKYIKRQGHGLKREPYTLNPVEAQVLAMYDDDTLLKMHQIFPLVISSFCRRLRPPTYVGRVERSLRGYIRERLPEEVTVAILCVGGLGQVARLWEVKSYNSRRSAADVWYAGIIKNKEQVKPGLESGRTSMRFGRKPVPNEKQVQDFKMLCSSPEATSSSYKDTSMVFNTSMAAGMPMEALDSEQLETLLPDLPPLTQIWLTTAETLVIKSKIVERAADIKRNQQVMLDLIMEENEEDHDDEKWYGRLAPELVDNLAETMGQSLPEPDQDQDHSGGSSAEKKTGSEVHQVKEERDLTLVPFSRIALCWYALMGILDRPPTNSKRVTYRCGCGDLRYLDVEELVPGGADELQEILRADAQAVRQRGSVQDTSSSNLPALPPEAHLTPLGQRNNQGHDESAQGSRSQGPGEPRILDKSSMNRTYV